jgi:hypothetical protein
MEIISKKGEYIIKNYDKAAGSSFFIYNFRISRISRNLFLMNIKPF